MTSATRTAATSLTRWADHNESRLQSDPIYTRLAVNKEKPRMLIKNGTNLGKPLKSLLVRGLDAKLQLGCCTWSKNWVVEWTWFLNRAVFNWAKGRIYSLTFCSWTSTKANQFTFQHQVNFWPRAAAKRGNFRGKKQRSLDVHDVRNQAQLCPVTPTVTPTARYLCNLRRNVAKMQFSSNQPSPAEEWVGTHCLCHDCNIKTAKV